MPTDNKLSVLQEFTMRNHLTAYYIVSHLLIAKSTYYIVSHGIYLVGYSRQVARSSIQVGKLVKYEAHLL